MEMNKAQRKYVADFEANMAGKQYNIFDCITFATEYNQIDATPDPIPEYVVKLDGKTIYTSPIKEASFDLATDYLEKMRNSVAMNLKANVLAYEKGKKLVIETLLQKYVYTVDKYTVEKL